MWTEGRYTGDGAQKRFPRLFSCNACPRAGGQKFCREFQVESLRSWFGIHSPDYLFTADKYIHEATTTHHNGILVVAQKKEVVFVRLELTTFTLQHDALPHRNCPCTTGAPGAQTCEIAQTDILRTQARPNYIDHACISNWSQIFPPNPKMKCKAVLHADCDLHRNWVNCMFLNHYH